MILYQDGDRTVSLPLPLFLVIEDVGWWQGEDGSRRGEPYRNGFCRRHCLADYRALVDLSERLSMRVAVAMVVGEWDRTNLLRDIAGATWLGRAWDNRRNQGPWLAEAASYLCRHERHLELAVHGLCHEFWRDGKMQRAEFHDDDGLMRSREIVAGHLRAYAAILRDNGFSGFPRFFVPPALRHSFGNGDGSMQAVLNDFGITHVTTRFARARQYSPPIHDKLTWECGVALLERGLSPVAWPQAAAEPQALPLNPIVALHWGNLLHPDPARNGEIIARWAQRIVAEAADIGRIMAIDVDDCWRQAAVCYLARFRFGQRMVGIDLRDLPSLPYAQWPILPEDPGSAAGRVALQRGPDHRPWYRQRRDHHGCGCSPNPVIRRSASISSDESQSRPIPPGIGVAPDSRVSLHPPGLVF